MAPIDSRRERVRLPSRVLALISLALLASSAIAQDGWRPYRLAVGDTVSVPAGAPSARGIRAVDGRVLEAPVDGGVDVDVFELTLGARPATLEVLVAGSECGSPQTETSVRGVLRRHGDTLVSEDPRWWLSTAGAGGAHVTSDADRAAYPGVDYRTYYHLDPRRAGTYTVALSHQPCDVTVRLEAGW